MRRIQVHIDEAMDDELAAEARRRGMSKAGLIRLLLSQQSQATASDPVDALIGTGDGDPAEDIDAVVYGR
ncbi:MAG: CopG family transcriptional regulator [Acidimicrobiia bacterium]|nr:CopG family transcriptional regulator [Acidimicrobiia bacterium]